MNKIYLCNLWKPACCQFQSSYEDTNLCEIKGNVLQSQEADLVEEVVQQITNCPYRDLRKVIEYELRRR